MNYAIYLKPTNKCNKRCWFCYDPHEQDSDLLKDPNEAFNIVDQRILTELSTSSGSNIQFILHGGEFFLVGEYWLELFLSQLTKKYPKLQLCGMSNLSSAQFRKCYDVFRKYNGNIGTSYNSELFSDVWIENLNYVLEKQKNVNLNKVYTGENLDFDQLMKEISSFLKYDNWSFKLERVVKKDIEDLYYASSMMSIQFVEWCFSQDARTLKHFSIFLFCLLKNEIDRKFSSKKNENYGITLCDPRCCSTHFVIDNALNIGKCTKFYKNSKKFNLLEYSNISELMRSKGYRELNECLMMKSCTNSECEMYKECVGGCKLTEVQFDSKNECSNNSLFQSWLKQLKSEKLLELIEKNVVLKQYANSLKKIRIY